MLMSTWYLPIFHCTNPWHHLVLWFPSNPNLRDLQTISFVSYPNVGRISRFNMSIIHLGFEYHTQLMLMSTWYLHTLIFVKFHDVTCVFVFLFQLLIWYVLKSFHLSSFPIWVHIRCQPRYSIPDKPKLMAIWNLHIFHWKFHGITYIFMFLYNSWWLGKLPNHSIYLTQCWDNI